MSYISQIIMNNSKQNIDLRVDEWWCMENYPYKHYVKVKYKNGSVNDRIMSGIRIVKTLKQLNKHVPSHFKMYENI